MTPDAGSPPAPLDLAREPHLNGVFAPVVDEVEAGDLTILGELPAEMDGLYLRNGPNPRFTPLGSYVYPLEGDGMVHGVWISQKRARYANRFVQTPALYAEEKAGRALWGGIMTGYLPSVDQVGPTLAGTDKDLPDINVVRYLVLVLAPFYFDVAAAMSGGSLLSWRPDDGTRIALIPRDGSPVRWVSTDAYWSWHNANAYDEGEGRDARVVLDYVEWSRPGGMTADTSPITGGIRRAEIDPARGTITRRWLADEGSTEFPRIADRRIGRRHDTIALGAKTMRHELVTGDHDALLWLRCSTGETARWDADGLAVGEPVFVPRPGDDDVDHGWWVTFATDRGDLSSWFLVIPAADPSAGPVARVRMPVRVPLGLHGTWLPTEE